MNEYQTLNHTKWECKYHVVFIPKCRRKVLYGQLRHYLDAEHTKRWLISWRVHKGGLLPSHNQTSLRS